MVQTWDSANCECSHVVPSLTMLISRQTVCGNSAAYLAVIKFGTLTLQYMKKVRPWHLSGLEDEFPPSMGYFQGRTVNLPVGNI